MTDPLTRLAIANGTDKFGYHDYTPKYHRLFAHLRKAPVRLLEIGVGGYQDADRGGESLETWRDYFPNGRIVGIDIQEKRLDLGPRITVLQGSQVDAGFLDRVVGEHGPFDIIVDDGSHQNAHVVDSFNLLYPTLAPGGIYVVEDVQTAFFPRFGGSLTLDAPNSVGYLGALFAELLTGDAPLDIARITRFHNMIAVHKTPEGGRPDTRAALAAALPEGAPRHEAPADGAAQALSGPFAALPDGGALILNGSDWPDAAASLARDLFRDIDHREIAVNFPEHAPHPQAARIAALIALPGCLAVERGQNDYPSNFAFDFDHPEVRPVFATIEAVLAEEGRERGLLQFVDLLVRAGDEAKAAELLDRLSRTGATSRSFYNFAVRQARRAGEWERARALLEQAVAHHPEDARLRGQLAGVLARLGDHAAARPHLEEACRLAPRDGALRMQLATLLSRLGDHAAALAEADEALALGARKPAQRLEAGLIQLAAGQAEEAVTTFRALCRQDDAPPAAWRQLSRALEATGQRDEALAAIERAIALAPDNAEYRRWQARLMRP